MAARSISPTTTEVEGSVDPFGQQTRYQVEYGPASSAWCASHGTKGTPENQTPPLTIGPRFAEEPRATANVYLHGLSPGDEYCAELIAENSVGTGYGGQVEFTAGAPSFETLDTEPSAPTATVLYTRIGLAEQPTEYDVAYSSASTKWCLSRGTAGAPEHTTTPVQLAVAPLGYLGEEPPRPVSPEITGLTPGAGYCAAVAASNASGSSHSEQLHFTAGLPHVFTFKAEPSPPRSTSAEIYGTINPAGQATQFRGDYGLLRSTWCEGGPAAPEHVTAPVTLAASDGTSHFVNVNLTGLSPGSTYCAELAANYTTGSATGGQFVFTTPDLMTVEVAGPGTGAVSGLFGKCTKTCSYEYWPGGGPGTLTATPAVGSMFLGWSGACSGSGDCSPPLGANVTATATFAATPPHEHPTSSGTISIVTTNLAVRNGQATVTFSCAATEECRGRFTLTAPPRAGKHTTRTLAAASLALPAGKTEPIHVKLSKVGRLLLREGHGNHTATLTIVKTAPSPTRTTIRSVRLTEPHHHKAK
jgi:hypothetical protein